MKSLPSAITYKSVGFEEARQKVDASVNAPFVCHPQMNGARDADDAFKAAVPQEFGLLAHDCGAELTQVESLIFGFVTDHAVLTVGAYPGHFRGICVKLRRRENGEMVMVKDGLDIGLANV